MLGKMITLLESCINAGGLISKGIMVAISYVPLDVLFNQFEYF
jgi:hypothetical protein